MKRTLILVAALFCFALFPVQSAFAHVFITDTTNTKGAILHINPDDDPVAGQTSTLFFDMQTPQKSAKLTVKNSQGLSAAVNATITDSLATFTYIFPTQGTYDLTLQTTTASAAYTFTYSQRVSRGTAIGAVHAPTYSWAEILLTISSLALICLAIIAFNRRASIAAQSIF